MSPGTVLAFDYGARFIGVAVGERELGVPHPLDTIDARDPERRFAAIAAHIATWHPRELVVGMPLSMDGAPHALTEAARRFARALEERFGLQVTLIDERLTSADAASRLRDIGRGGRKHKNLAHPVAAQIILQDFFDTHAAA